MARITWTTRTLGMALALFVALLNSQSASAQVNVTTYHNDNARTGQNLNETILTAANVNPATFGKLFTQPVDGNVLAQPLYLSNVNIPGVGKKNVVFVATERDSIYAFDADSTEGPSAGLLWQNSLYDPAKGITWIPNVAANQPDICCCCSDIIPDLGITATPVIDAANGILYTITKTKEIRGEERHYVQTLYALDVATGFQLAQFVIGDTTVTGTSCSGPGGLIYSYDDFGPIVFGGPMADDSIGGVIHFNALTGHLRSGLVLSNGVVYAAWSSHCDRRPYHGWIMGFDALTLQLVSWFNTTPGSPDSTFRSGLGGIWMGGGAPAIDEAGRMYCVTGNGTTGEDVLNNDYGESVLRLSTPDLLLTDFFTPYNQRALDQADTDLGSGGILVLPDQEVGPLHLMVTAGKQGTIYLIDRDRLGGFLGCGEACNNVVQVVRLDTSNRAQQGTPALYQNLIYFGASGDFLKAFELSGGLLSLLPVSQSSTRFGNKGTTASVSANGNKDGIVWAIEYASRNAILHAYDATNLAVELYTSGEDGVIGGSKFSLPTVANGKVYIGIGQSSPTDFGGLVVFGLL